MTMPEIKTRDVVSGTIKTVDQTALAGQRMKNAYIKTRKAAEHSVYSSEGNTEEYASDRLTESMETAGREAVHQVDVQGQKIIQGVQRRNARSKENRQAQQSPEPPAPDSPQTDAPTHDSPQPVQSFAATGNTPYVQQPHRVPPDGAATPVNSEYARADPGTAVPMKQEAIHNKQIASAKAELKAKRASQRMEPSGLQQDYDAPSFPSQGETTHSIPIQGKSPRSIHVPVSKTIKTVERTGDTIKQAARSTGNITVKAPARTIKTADATVKTVEQMGGTVIKSTQAAARTAQKTAAQAARNAQRLRAAAKAATAAAKALAVATAKAVKAIIAAAQELLSALVAGGGMVLILMIVLIIMCFAGMMFASDEDDTEILPVSEEVKAYEPVIQKYAKEHGIGDYVLLIEAVMMLESGGRGTDPMQCSECNFNTLYPHTPGSITDPEYSINVGIQNLADCLEIAQCEGPMDIDAIKLALQGYNYGQGYITWAVNKYGEYSKANAVEFSLKTAEQLGWDRYGNMDYVPLVLQYYPLGQIFYDPDTSQLIVEVARSQIGNVGGEPYWRWYGFTERVGWCACFVSWCANECGYIDAGIFPRFSGPEWGVYWFKQRGQWLDRQATPSPGMIIFYDWDSPETGGQDGVTDHVGIVSHVENGLVYTIEGNSVGDSCRERSRELGNYQIMGYGVPEY